MNVNSVLKKKVKKLYVLKRKFHAKHKNIVKVIEVKMMMMMDQNIVKVSKVREVNQIMMIKKMMEE